MEPIYLDYAATTPLDPQILEAMLPYFQEIHGNPSSLHGAGQRARRALERAREQVAFAIGAKPKEIVFSSGATEADNHVLRAVAAAKPGGHLVTSPLEHAAVLSTAKSLEAGGYRVAYIAPDTSGVIQPEAVRAALTPGTALVALMLINNETGVKTEIATISELVHEAGALLFCDAVQALGFETLDVNTLGVDFMSLSAHKAYGPKGVGALYVRESADLSAFLLGGSQERGLRAGTHNLPAIMGMGEAAELATSRLHVDRAQVAALRDSFEAAVLELPGTSLNAAGAPRSVKHSNLRFEDVDGEALLMSLDALGIQASAGSACAAGSLEPSHVLSAMGLGKAEAKASVRFSFGRDLDQEACRLAAGRVKQAVTQVRAV